MYQIESDVELTSDWLPPAAFTTMYGAISAAVPITIEGVDHPAVEEVRVVDTDSGRVVWRSTEEEYE